MITSALGTILFWRRAEDGIFVPRDVWEKAGFRKLKPGLQGVVLKGK